VSVLVDTGAFYALADEGDRHASAARAFFNRSLGVEDLVTTSAVLIESWTLIRNKMGWEAGRLFFANLKASEVKILYFESADLEIAARIMDEYADQKLSLVDATSFAVMERHGIASAFTFDKDFLLYRFGPKKQRSFRCLPS
jgi:uncharacterized protein